MTRFEKPVREVLCSWWFWVAVAYFGLACVVVALYFINGRTSHDAARVARDEAIHQSEIVSARQAAYTQCLASIPELEKINGFVGSVRAIRDALEQNSTALLDSTPPGAPLYTVRVHSLARLRMTAKRIEAVHFQVPTIAECNARGGPKPGKETK